MAKCDLSIELDDPNGIHHGGGKITGTVHVNATGDVRCKALEVKSIWRTHGRGNVDQGVIDRATVFQGEWVANERQSYRFELKIGDWPPTYHGNYLSVDHYVEATADIPWAFDPKTRRSFSMSPTCGPDGATAQRETAGSALAGKIFGSVFIVVFVGIFLLTPVGWIGLPFLFLISFGIWLFRSFLPKRALGTVECSLTEDNVHPGGKLSGTLQFTPRKALKINGVTMNFHATEKCVSGSGSNRKTHTHSVFKKTEILEPQTTLPANQSCKYDFEIDVPDDTPYSMDLKDNDLIVGVDLRIDIPRWPDWTRKFPLLVVPSAEPIDAQLLGGTNQPTANELQFDGASGREMPLPSTPADSLAPPVGSTQLPNELTFTETASHLWPLRNDRDQIEVLVDAVTGLTFMLEAIVERRLLYSGDDDPHVYPDGYAVWAHFIDPPLPMVLYVPHDLADEFEAIGRDPWKGKGTVVGWDHQHRRLQVKLITEPT